MSLFGWDKRLATGIDSIDAQHRELFQIAKGLHDAYRTGDAKNAVTRTLNFLVDYCLTHFEDEEAQMMAMGFPDFAIHQEEHRKCLAHILDLKDRYAGGQSEVAMDLSVLVSRWSKQHIRESDLRFAEFVKSNTPEPS